MVEGNKNKQCFTDLSKNRQAPAIFLTLEGKAREVVLELEVEKLSWDDGVKNIIEKLGKLYLKDKTQSAYQAYDNFEKFRRPLSMSVSDYIIEFERLLNKTKEYESDMSSDILAYRLLKSANLNEQQEQLAKATISTLTYESMKTQLKKIFGDDLEVSMGNNSSDVHVNIEPILETSHIDEEIDEYDYEDAQDEIYYGYHRPQGVRRSGINRRPSTYRYYEVSVFFYLISRSSIALR